jgi:methionyl-tRNA synthetase
MPKFLITSAIPYVNGVKHLGNLVGSLLAARSEVPARSLYCRHLPILRCSDARGDQCEACGTLLDPPELIRPHSAISGDQSLELRLSRHLFLRQSLLVERLRAWLETRNGWPPFVVSLAKSWLTSELHDCCITRDLSWGIPVPPKRLRR